MLLARFYVVMDTTLCTELTYVPEYCAHVPLLDRASIFLGRTWCDMRGTVGGAGLLSEALYQGIKQTHESGQYSEITDWL